MPRSGAAPTRVARALAYALVQVRPEGEGSGRAAEKAYRAQFDQWETDVMAVSLALQLVMGIDDARFRRDCQGPKDRGEEPEI